MNLVTRAAELFALVKRLEEGLLVERGLGLDELSIDPLQERVLAECKRIVQGLLDGVRAIAAVILNVRDAMTHATRDARMRRGVLFVVEVRIVERTTEERHGIVTRRTEA